VPREDPAALARGLVRFLADTDLAESVGAIARRRAEATFSLEAVGAQLRALLVDR
jgi:glycosyltransferase involved in cell wall biosynthesis